MSVQNNSVFDSLVEMMKDAGIDLSQPLMASGNDSGVTIMRATMTPMELVRSIDQHQEAVYELIGRLAAACGECEGCELCKTTCLEPPVSIPSETLEEAGIPKGSKLTAMAEDEGIICVTEAGYRYDLQDVPGYIVDCVREAGRCLFDLDELMRDNHPGVLLFPQDEPFCPNACPHCGSCQNCEGEEQ